MRTALRVRGPACARPSANTPALSGWWRTSRSISRTSAWRLIAVGSASAMARISARRASASARSSPICRLGQLDPAAQLGVLGAEAVDVGGSHCGKIERG